MTHAEMIAHLERRIPHTALAPLGIRVERFDPDEVTAALDIDERHLQPMGFLHGGISVLLAETVASIAAAMSVDVEREDVFGVDINATHVKSKRGGTIRATARPIKRGRTMHFYAIDIVDETGDLVCTSRCTIAVRPRR